MIRIYNKQWILIELIIFYCLLSSARASCTLGQNPYIDLFLSIVVFSYFISKRLFSTSLKKQIASFVFVLAVFWTMHGALVHAYIGELANVAIPILIFHLRRDKQIELLQFLSKALAILLLLSLIAWLLSFWGLVLPYTSEYKNLDYTYGVINENHFLYLKVVSLDSTGNAIIPDIVRFNGIFLEPGHAGSIIAFFLFANKYDFSKWYVKLLFGIVIVTLSAAAYVLVFVGYVFTACSESRISKLVIRISLMALLLVLVAQYNDGDNIVNNVVFDKLFNSNRGLDNRFTGEVSNAYDKLWIQGEYMTGLSGKVNVEHSAGYKVFIIQQGLLGVFLVIFSYYLMHKISNTRLGFLFFAMVIMSFLQRVYFTWDAYLVPYILGLSYFTIKQTPQKTS